MRNFVASRGIHNLMHFTRLENLPAILQNGIVPRNTLVAGQMPFTFNDAHRYDGYLNASCFTISWPNYKMFFPLRRDHPDVKWAVIECNASILWQKPCIFSATNAASNVARGIGLDLRTGVPGIEAMFAEVPGKPTRAEMRLPANFPTDPQAEVLVCDVVEPQYFVRVHVEDALERAGFAGAHPGVNFVYAGYERSRFDYQYWR